MRRTVTLLTTLAVPAILFGAWSLAANARGNGLFAWNAARGELRVLEPGWHLLPRWSWARSPRAPLTAAGDAASSDDAVVELTVVWNPEPGSFRLLPAPDAAAGLAGRIESVAAGLLAEVPLACVAEELATAAACPEAWERRATERLAAALASRPERVRVRYAAAPDGVRQALLRTIAAQLPSTGQRVFVLGLDGFDWEYVLPLVEAGAMPNLSRLLAAGTWGTLEPFRPMLSPLLWTSIATGVDPEAHGVLDFVEIDPETQQQVPVTGRSRAVPALWNIASALGRRVDVVGWWGTWPAERLRGTMVSDRLYYTLTQGIEQEVLREDPAEMVAPAERTAIFASLRDRIVRETDWEAVQELMEVGEEEFRRAVDEGAGMEDPIDGFRRILAATRTYLEAGLEMAPEAADLLLVYLEGTDTIGHVLARYMPPPVDPDIEPRRAAIFAAAVPRYFAEVDRWIGRYLEALPLDEVTWVVVSDHGFKWGGERPRETGHFDATTAALWHTDDAIFLLSGPGVAPQGRVEEAGSVYDVAPTVAALLGLPPGEGWQGSLLPGVSGPDLEPLDYPRLVPPTTYRAGDLSPAPVDQEFLEQLRALGYLGAAEEPAPSVAPQQPGEGLAAEIPAHATQGALNNLGIFYLGQGRLEEAERVLREAIRRFPDFAGPYYNLRNVYMRQQRYDEADRHLWLAAERSPVDPTERIQRAAADYVDAEEIGRAVTVLAEAVRRLPDSEALWVDLLYNRGRLNQCGEGLSEGRQAAERLPRSPRVLTLYGLAAGCAGEHAEARRALERSLAIDPDQPTARNALATLR